LQPCDVGVFGPLASSWKAEVNHASTSNIIITKFNFLEYYHNARSRAMTPGTIISAFRKTGICPFDPDIIEDEAFAPSLNTTTQAAMPIPATLPPFVEWVDDNSNEPENQSAGTSTTLSQPTFIIHNFPQPLRANASRTSYLIQYEKLRTFALQAKAQMEADYAIKRLMEAENERLRQIIHTKKRERRERRDGGSAARHMTGEEMMEELAKADWEVQMRDVFEEAKPHFKQLRRAIQTYEKEVVEQAKRAERQRQTALKDGEREKQKALKTTFTFVCKRVAQLQKAAQRELTQLQKEMEMAEKRAVAQGKRDAAAKKRADLDTKRALARQKKEAVQTARQQRQLQQVEVSISRSRQYEHSRNSPQSVSPPATPKPPQARPRPRIIMRKPPTLPDIEPSNESRPMESNVVNSPLAGQPVLTLDMSEVARKDDESTPGYSSQADLEPQPNDATILAVRRSARRAAVTV
jgi:hypothetical protein